MENPAVKNTIIVAVAIFVVGIFFSHSFFDLGFFWGNENSSDAEATSIANFSGDYGLKDVDISEEKLHGVQGTSVKVADAVIGTGITAALGDKVAVHYVGRFEDGSEFDNSLSRKTPFIFEIGKGEVIAGWDEGVPGMRVGGVRRIVIKPSSGYGSRGLLSASGEYIIPPNTTLIFDIALLNVNK